MKVSDADFDKLFTRKAAEPCFEDDECDGSGGGEEEEKEEVHKNRVSFGASDGTKKDDEEEEEEEQQPVVSNNNLIAGTIPDVILKAHKEKDYFTALNLPHPSCDDVGDPVWKVSAAELSKAFRKRSLQTHPDKNLAKNAREAFDVLSECHKKLREEGTRNKALKDFAAKAWDKRCEEDPELRAKAGKIREKREAEKFKEEIKRQREQGRASKLNKGEAKRRRKRRADEDEEARKMRELLEDEDEDEDDKVDGKKTARGSEDENEDIQRVATALQKKKKKKKSFLF